MTRLTREESTAETRKRLLAAARRVFLRQGFHGASLEQVAEEAGFTKGAVYSRFESKADLFLALLDERITETEREFERVAAEGMNVREFSEEFARRRMPWLRRERDWFLLNIEFLVHAMRDPKLRRQYAQRRKAGREAFGRLVANAPDAEELPISPAEVVLMGAIYANGLGLEMVVSPEEVPEDFYERITTYLFRGMGLSGDGAATVTSPAKPKSGALAARGH